MLGIAQIVLSPLNCFFILDVALVGWIESCSGEGAGSGVECSVVRFSHECGVGLGWAVYGLPFDV